MIVRVTSILFYAAALLAPTNNVQAAELVMFESETCEWCDAWHAEIGPIYPKTDEGKRAPLRMVDIHDVRPSDLAGVEGIRFTPTFVLLGDEGEEMGRINGYPGEDFFWGMLGELIAKLPAEPKSTTKARIDPLGKTNSLPPSFGNLAPSHCHEHRVSDAHSYSIHTEYNS